MSQGYFVDWDGNIRSTDAPGRDYRCEVDPVARYVAVLGKYGTVTHESSFYRTLEEVAKAGITARLVDEAGNPITP